MFWTRLISGAVLLVILAAAIICGNWILWGLCFLISLIGLYELYRVFGFEKKLLGAAGYLAVIVYYMNLRLGHITDDMIMVNMLVLMMMAIYVFSYPRYRAKQIAEAFFGVFYVGVMLSFIYQIRMPVNGFYDTWLIFICAWGCDTCAYCAGMLFGKHKMVPKLSPKKTIEGAVGGVLGAALIGAIYGAVLYGKFSFPVQRIGAYAIICGCGAVIAQIGDLAASAIKRNYEVKDYGHLIPGHGGILDRFDSVILTAPMIYVLAEFLVQH